MGNCNGNSDGNGDGDGVGVGDGDGNGKGDGHCEGNHEGRVASSCGGNVHRFLDGQHLASTPMDIRKVHSPALRHGGDTAKSVCFPSRGGFLTANHGFFSLLFTTTVQLTEQPSDCPPHYSGAQEPSCQPIDALPPPLLQNPLQPIDNLPRLLLHFLSR